MTCHTRKTTNAISNGTLSALMFGWLTDTLKRDKATVNGINYTCAFHAEKGSVQLSHTTVGVVAIITHSNRILGGKHVLDSFC